LTNKKRLTEVRRSPRRLSLRRSDLSIKLQPQDQTIFILTEFLDHCNLFSPHFSSLHPSLFHKSASIRGLFTNRKAGLSSRNFVFRPKTRFLPSNGSSAALREPFVALCESFAAIHNSSAALYESSAAFHRSSVGLRRSSAAFRGSPAAIRESSAAQREPSPPGGRGGRFRPTWEMTGWGSFDRIPHVFQIVYGFVTGHGISGLLTPNIKLGVFGMAISDQERKPRPLWPGFLSGERLHSF
jgi:hypothetical protein